jgi:predicted HTH transcriptional regulator
MDLQELITRGRFIFASARERLGLFALVDGRRNAKEIAKSTKRHINNVHRDLRLLADSGLIEEKTKNGAAITKDGCTVYQKVPLARTIPLSYFTAPPRPLSSKSAPPRKGETRTRAPRGKPLSVPSENEILDICKKGEDQTIEFKAAGTEVRKIVREIAAMLNTREGGLIFYGVDDDGTIQGTDVARQKFDQPLQNSIKTGIAPAAVVTLKSAHVIGSELLIVIVSPWNRKEVYQFDEKVLIRKGTNVFGAKPEEMKKLHRGEYVI